MSSEIRGHLKHKGEAKAPPPTPTPNRPEVPRIFQKERRRLQEVAVPGASGVARWGSPAVWGCGAARGGGRGPSASTRPGPWRCSQVPEPRGVFKGCLRSLKRARRRAGRFVFAKQSMKGE